MRCGEIREYLFAFVDNELETPISIEFQRHVELCPECAREAEIEWAIKGQLKHALQSPADDPALQERTFNKAVEGAVAQVGVGRVFSRRVFFPVALAAAVALAASAWMMFRGGDVSRSPSRFVDLVVADFAHFLEKGMPLQVASADPQIVAGWLYEQTAIDVALPDTRAGSCKLLGGRKCKLDGKPAAFAAYDMDGVPSTLVVVDGESGTLDGMTPVNHAGKTHWVGYCKGHTVVAWRRGERVYAAVSTRSEKDLLFLLTGAEHEGD